MNCPHCNQPVPENYPASYCFHCGQSLPPASPDPASILPPVKIKWRWFWLALLAPPVLTMLSALVMQLAWPAMAGNEPISPVVAFSVSIIGGIASGIIIGIKRGQTKSERIINSIVCSIVFSIVCLVLSIAGCSAGGYHFVIQ